MKKTKWKKTASNSPAIIHFDKRGLMERFITNLQKKAKPVKQDKPQQTKDFHFELI